MLIQRKFVLLSTQAFIVAQTDAQVLGNFTAPGPQIVAGDFSTASNFQYGQTQTFRWNVNIPGVRLALWQQYNGSGIVNPRAEDILDRNNTQKFFIWSGVPTQDLSYGHTFFLQIYDASLAVGAAPLIATSGYFNISSPPAPLSVSSSTLLSSSSSTQASSVTQSSQVTSSTISSSAPTSSTASLTSAAASATSTPEPIGNNGNTLAIGLGVGLGCALLLILLAIAFFLGRYKRNRQQGSVPNTSQHHFNPSERRSGTEALPVEVLHWPHRSDDPQVLHSHSYLPPQEKPGDGVTPPRSELQ